MPTPPDLATTIRSWFDQIQVPLHPWTREAVAAALDNPRDYPHLYEAWIPGDRIALAVGPLLPDPIPFIGHVVDYLIAHGLDPEQLHVVLANDSSRFRDGLIDSLAKWKLEPTQVSNHDPFDEKKLEFLAADMEANPVYVNRAIMEADLVLPIVGFRHPKALSYFGPQALVPWFVDHQTQRRLRTLTVDATDEGAKQRRQFGEWVARLAGIAYVLGIVPTRKPPYIALASGDPHAIEHQWITDRTAQDSDDSQGVVNKQASDWVLAHIGSSTEFVSWNELACVLTELLSQLSDQGNLILCSSISRRVQGALKLLGSTDSDDELEKKLLKSELPNALAAFLIWHALQSCHIYLMSQHERDALESIHIGRIEHIDPILRLTSQSQRGTIINNALLDCQSFYTS